MSRPTGQCRRLAAWGQRRPDELLPLASPT